MGRDTRWVALCAVAGALAVTLTVPRPRQAGSHIIPRLQIPSRLIVWEEENHWIAKGEDSRYFYQELLAWLKKYL